MLLVLSFVASAQLKSPKSGGRGGRGVRGGVGDVGHLGVYFAMILPAPSFGGCFFFGLSLQSRLQVSMGGDRGVLKTGIGPQLAIGARDAGDHGGSPNKPQIRLY